MSKATHLSLAHIGDVDIEDFIKTKRRQLRSNTNLAPGTLMDVYTTVNPLVVGWIIGSPPHLEERVKMALGLKLYRDSVIVSRPTLRVVGA